MKNEIVEFNEFETKLAEFKGVYDDVIYNLNDPDQEKQAKADKRSIGSVINLLDAKHKELKAPLKAKTDLIDHERKRIKDDLLDIKIKVTNQLDEHKNQIAAHAAKLHAMVDSIKQIAIFDEFETPNSAEVKIRLDELMSVVLDDSYEYRKADAALAIAEGQVKLKSLYDIRVTFEEQQIKLAEIEKAKIKQEQKERETQIAKEAAEAATKAAEKKASDKIIEAKQKEMKAKDLAISAKANAKALADQAVNKERQRIEREQLKERQDTEKLEAKDKAKKEKQSHRAKIHKAIKNDLICEGVSEELAVKIINLIKDGEISHLVINY